MPVGENPYLFLKRHTDVSHETVDRLCLYHDLLLKWQSKINLIGPDTIDDIWSRHFLDALQLLPLLPKENELMIDIGSGAGFPGMAIAVAGLPNIHLVESDAKKIAFLKEVARITNTSVFIHHERVEKLSIPLPNIIMARACSSLASLLQFSHHLVSHGTICLFHKGKKYSKEISDAQEYWSFEHAIIPSVTDEHGVILRLTHIRKREA